MDKWIPGLMPNAHLVVLFYFRTSTQFIQLFFGEGIDDTDIIGYLRRLIRIC